jgi:DNA-binding GntR family transcriptional regulator
MDKSLQTLIIDATNSKRMASRKNMSSPSGKAGEIVTELERQLILGYYKPGESLSFKMLADTFEVSRQPVSSAIGHLRALGYVEVLPQVGCRVVKPSREEVFDFFRIHSNIEAVAVELATERRTDEGVARLLAITPPSVTNLDRISERSAYIEYIDAFHDQIWAMAKAPMLAGQFGSMRNLASFYLWQGLADLTAQAAGTLNRQRNAIVKKIAAGDKDEASRQMKEHLLAKPILVYG